MPISIISLFMADFFFSKELCSLSYAVRLSNQDMCV